MLRNSFLISAILLLILLTACNEEKKNTSAEVKEKNSVESQDSILKKEEPKEEKPFVLTEENAIPFFFEYQKENQENKVKINTSMGSFVVQLYENTPYHRANFIYLTRKNYFENTYFHRVVKNFIIQGGNSDLTTTYDKRDEIGHYLLPPDTRNGNKHHRGTISMPSSDNVDNPHKLASPFEFFIVVKDPGSYHLDGKYTAFGKVISGMDVVDKINAVETDKREWPVQNVIIKSVEIVE